MLKRVVQKDGKDWDMLLPALLFAIREVPQASTGFSPFELVYGRRPRGLLDLVKETWESESSPHKTVVEHISQMRERVAKVMPMVREHMQKAQDAQRRVYNRSAKVRQLQVGDRVNYKVHQPGKRKPYQIYHINLLKLWRDREPVSAVVAVQSGDHVGIDLVQVAATLTRPQTQQVKEFLQRNRDMFSGLPGLTNVIEHDIVTEPKVKIRLKPYRIPEAHRVSVSGEVKRMLELGVIEESQSEWSRFF
ncbi:uncharacterized protein LOC120940531 [Rana temporaria]|uniref:uncharacterized protein LOC120940531 n=1 Tax=Rana temporaria TaxID=8407 RepID=UPI001AADFFCB|nr:uncharacterized protein LOC120940531 [Rana temporaria]